MLDDGLEVKKNAHVVAVCKDILGILWVKCSQLCSWYFWFQLKHWSIQRKKNFHLHCNLHYLAYSLYILNLPNYKTVFVIIPCCFNTA